MSSAPSETKLTQREKFLLSGLIVATVVGAILGLALIRSFANAPVSVTNLPQKVTVTGTAQNNSTDSWETIEIAFGGPCTQTYTNVPITTACTIQNGFTAGSVSWLPLYGAGVDGSHGQFTIILQNNQTYYLYLSYWGNFQQTQRDNCIAGLGLYPPQATSFFLHSTTFSYQINSTISCALPSQTIYGIS